MIEFDMVELWRI